MVIRLFTALILSAVSSLLVGCTVVSVAVGVTTTAVGGAIEVVDAVTPDIIDDDDDEDDNL